MDIIGEFRASHARLEGDLAAAEMVARDAQALLSTLRGLQHEVLVHLREKELFYARLVDRCASAEDTNGLQLAQRLQASLRAGHELVQRFFEDLDTLDAAAVSAQFPEVAAALRQRFTVEERGVFPLYLRHQVP